MSPAREFLLARLSLFAGNVELAGCARAALPVVASSAPRSSAGLAESGRVVLGGRGEGQTLLLSPNVTFEWSPL